MKITIVAASEGKNLELALEVQKYLTSQNVEARILDIVKLNLPLYSTLSEKTSVALEVVAPFQEFLNVDGYVFLSPEYNGSTPPAFTNFLAWVSRATKNWRDTFNGKMCAIGTHSAGSGLNVLNIMRLQLSFIGMNVIGRQMQTTPAKPLEEKSLRAVCDELMKWCGK